MELSEGSAKSPTQTRKGTFLFQQCGVHASMIAGTSLHPLCCGLREEREGDDPRGGKRRGKGVSYRRNGDGRQPQEDIYTVLGGTERTLAHQGLRPKRTSGEDEEEEEAREASSKAEQGTWAARDRLKRSKTRANSAQKGCVGRQPSSHLEFAPLPPTLHFAILTPLEWLAAHLYTLQHHLSNTSTLSPALPTPFVALTDRRDFFARGAVSRWLCWTVA